MQHAVVIPTYNAQAFIVRALESVRQQTLAASEIIVVDDGSTDRTVESIRTWADTHDLALTLLQIENSGAGTARNHALNHASADWISFLDADDEWVPEKLERVEAMASELEKLDFVHTGRIYFMPSGERLKSGFPADRMADRQYLCSGFTMKTSTVSIARDFLRREALEFGTERTSEDYFLFWRSVIRARAIAYIDEPLTVVHERQGSVTRSDNENTLILETIGVLAAIIEQEPQPSAEAVNAIRALSLFRYRLAQHVLTDAPFSPAALARDIARLSRSMGKVELLKVLASVALARSRRS